MKSRKLLSIQAVVLLAALAIPLRGAAQEQPRLAEVVTGADPGAANPVPLINQPLVPDTRRPGGAGFKLTVNGTGFVSGSVVNWNGSPRATTFVSGSQLTATVLASDVAKASTASVTVVNPSPRGGTSNSVFFSVIDPASVIGLSGSDFGAGGSYSSVATGDFNGDGKLDLAAANQSGSVSVLLGNGDGTFQTEANYSTGQYSGFLAVADFSGDGKLDLAVSNNAEYGGIPGVTVLLGNGDGTFGAAVNYIAGSYPAGLAVGDFNADGKLDLAVANSAVAGGTPSVSVLLGNGDGTFQAAVNYGAGTQPLEVAVGDFNRDSKLDLAVTNENSDNVSVLLGNGDGTFQVAVNYEVGPSPFGVTVGDFNRDGKLDLAVTNVAGNGQIPTGVNVLLGKGDGTFQAAVSYPLDFQPESVAVGDFNGDGKPDLAVANGNCVSVLLGNGDGTFQGATNFYSLAQDFSLAVGDFNGDGRLDTVVSNYGSSTVSVLLQAPAISLSTTSLNFATQVVGTTSTSQTMKITNGGLQLSISSIVVTGSNTNDFSQTNNCGSGLAPGASCLIRVNFAPTQVGPRTASVTLTDNAVGSPQTVSLSGTGVTAGPNATLSPTSLTFATQLLGTTSPTQSVTLTNYGAQSLLITSILPYGDFAQSNTCGSSLGTGASCTITVTFTPTRGGTRTGRVAITDNASGSPQTVTLTGTGTVVQLNPTSLTFFGSVTQLSTTLTNLGSTTLNISSITIAGSNEFSQTNDCGASVGAGKSCTITVTFKGTGFVSGAVSISDNGGGSPQTVALKHF
jgi:hypothetical protein